MLDVPGAPLRAAAPPDPAPGPGDLLLRVRACGVCRTDLHIVDGELPDPKLPLVPGASDRRDGRRGRTRASRRFSVGDRVGVPWLGWTCGVCRLFLSGRENLCDLARFTGYQLDGGYAELAVADKPIVSGFPPGTPIIRPRRFSAPV